MGCRVMIFKETAPRGTKECLTELYGEDAVQQFNSTVFVVQTGCSPEDLSYHLGKERRKHTHMVLDGSWYYGWAPKELWDHMAGKNPGESGK